MNPQVHTHTDVIYRRTSKGQAAAMPSAMPNLQDGHRRLLLLVNGFTSLGVLACVGRFDDIPDQMALELKSSGLIEEAGGYPAETFMRAPWREPPEH